MVDRGTIVKGAGGMAAGWGLGTRRSVSLPRGHVIGHAWPW